MNVWELRVQLLPKRENTRIFGAFIKPDTFVAIHQKPRSGFGGKEDPRWQLAIDRVVDDFADLFPQIRPVPARPFSNCVTFRGYDHEQ